MSFFIFLTVLQALVAGLLVVVILMQRSEGGGLGVGGSPSGLMSARGAADFLTRSTAVLATLFVILSITLATLAVGVSSSRKIDTTLKRTTTEQAPAPQPVDPLAGAAGAPPAGPAAPSGQAPAPAPANDPLAGAAKQ